MVFNQKRYDAWCESSKFAGTFWSKEGHPVCCVVCIPVDSMMVILDLLTVRVLFMTGFGDNVIEKELNDGYKKIEKPAF